MAHAQKTYDALLALKDAGAVTASGYTAVGGSTATIDLGSSTAQVVDGEVLIDVTAIDLASSDEQYMFILSGSNSPTFASGIEDLAVQRFGKASAVSGNGDVDTTVGRYIVPFRNEKNGRIYRYLRGELVIAGTTPSINFTAGIVKH